MIDTKRTVTFASIVLIYCPDMQPLKAIKKSCSEFLPQFLIFPCIYYECFLPFKKEQLKFY